MALLLWTLVTSCGYSTASFGQDLRGESPQILPGIGEIQSPPMSNARNPKTWLPQYLSYDNVDLDLMQESNGVQDAENELSRQLRELEVDAVQERKHQSLLWPPTELENLKERKQNTILWDENSTLQNDVNSQLLLGIDFLFGNSGSVDYTRAQEWLELAAMENNPEAQYYLGYMYAQGMIGAEHPSTQARELFEKAAKSGAPKPNYLIAQFYEQEIDGTKDLELAKRHYQVAVEKEFGPAKIALGRLHAGYTGGPVNREAAIGLFESAFEQDDSTTAQLKGTAAYELGVLLLASSQSEEELAEGRQWLERAVDRNHLDAKRHLGEDYLHGIGGRRDVDKAYKLLRQAASNGDATAQRTLAAMFRHGIGGVQDLGEAKHWYVQAANQGDSQAKLDLAKMLAEGPNAEQDQDQILKLFSEAANSSYPGAQVEFGTWLQAQGQGEEAFHWFTEAVKQNDVDGIIQMANAYRDGIGIQQDLAMARDLFTQLTNQGHAVGQTQLAQMLLTEEDRTDVELKRAVELLRLASNQDHAPALLATAGLYRAGTGVDRDPMIAYQLGRKAAELGSEEAIEEEPNLLQDYCTSTDNACIAIPVLYLTDRKVTGDSRLDYLYSNMRQIWPDGEDVNRTALHYGVLMVTVPVGRRITDQQMNWWKKILNNIWQSLRTSRPHPNTDTIIRNINPLTQAEFGELLQDQIDIRDPRRVMVFVHGFNNSFSFAARRLAEFSSRINFDGVVVMFSWPSSNKARFYMEDDEQVEQSCPRFSYALNRIYQLIENTQVDVVAHSMGAKLLFDSLTAGQGGRCAAPDINLKDIVLAAPDIRVSTFKESFDIFSENAEQITLYASSKDKALFLSSSVLRAGKRASRLGQGGEKITVLEGMHSLDASRVEHNIFRDPTTHAYVFVNEIVARDVQELLMDNKKPDSRACLRESRRNQLTYWTFEPTDNGQCAVGK